MDCVYRKIVWFVHAIISHIFAKMLNGSITHRCENDHGCLVGYQKEEHQWRKNTLPETNSSHLKIYGGVYQFPFGMAYFQGLC